MQAFDRRKAEKGAVAAHRQIDGAHSSGRQRADLPVRGRPSDARSGSLITQHRSIWRLMVNGLDPALDARARRTYAAIFSG